jgi:hypothetical protein
MREMIKDIYVWLTTPWGDPSNICGGTFVIFCIIILALIIDGLRGSKSKFF